MDSGAGDVEIPDIAEPARSARVISPPLPRAHQKGLALMMNFGVDVQFLFAMPATDRAVVVYFVFYDSTGGAERRSHVHIFKDALRSPKLDQRSRGANGKAPCQNGNSTGGPRFGPGARARWLQVIRGVRYEFCC